MTPTFTQFLLEYYPKFSIDENAHPVIKLLELYTAQDKKFEKTEIKIGNQTNLSLSKGFFIMGAVGTGKTALMRLYQKYLWFIKDHRCFQIDITWKLADRYQVDGVSVFTKSGGSHMMYDEFALVDESTDYPTQEVVGYFGNKVLAGEKIIRYRYEEFTNGRITHFTSNTPLADIRKIYLERVYSRLHEMCNFIVYTGVDRRLAGKSTSFVNPAVRKIEEPVEVVQKRDETQTMKDEFNNLYQMYLQTGKVSLPSGYSHYMWLKELKPEGLLTEKEIEIQVRPAIYQERKKYVDDFKHGKDRDESNRYMELRRQYAAGDVDSDEQMEVMRKSFKAAIIMYFERCKREGVSVLFS